MSFIRRKLQYFMFISTFGHGLSGCYILEKLPFQETKIKVVVVPAPEKKDPEVVDPEPSSLGAARLTRRLTLDLALRLPYDYEIEGLVATPDTRSVLIESLLNGAAAPQAIANLHARMWHLNAEDLPDLDEFAVNDAQFRTSLTNVRYQVLQEPILLVRKVLQDKMPFKNILTGNFSIVSSTVRDFWGLSDDGQAWPDDTYRYVKYADDRPEAGLLAANGWLSAFPGRRERVAKHRSYRTLSELTCRTLDAPEAHLFKDLNQANFEGGIEAFALTSKTCAGCHQTLVGSSNGQSGIGTASTFDSWKTYEKTSWSSPGSYNGSSFSNMAEFARMIARDPQFMRCERDKIIAALLQHPTSTLEQTLASLVLDTSKENTDWLLALDPLFQSSAYAYAPIEKKIKGVYLRQATGLRVLRRYHFEAFVKEWAPTLLTEGLDMALDPGIDEASGDEDMIPTGPYWHSVNKISRQLAYAIVTHDLGTGLTQDERYFLKLLPAGTGYGASAENITNQIIATWHDLTTETLTDGSETLTQFQTLWQGSGSITSADGFRRAWNVVLIGMLTHPQFLTY